MRTGSTMSRACRNHKKGALSLKRAIETVFQLIEWICEALLVLMVSFVVIQVVCRFLHVPTPWTEEMARYLYVYITFLGSAVALKEKEHVVIDLLLSKLKKRPRKVMDGMISLLIALFLFCFIKGIYTALMTSGEVSSVSFAWFKHKHLYGPVLFAGMLMGLTSLVQAGQAFIEAARKENTNE